MKIYERVVIDIATDKIISEDSYEYYGEVALCGGSGGGGSTTVDEEYNRRMAAIYEEQQDIANYYFENWKGLPEEYESAQLTANIGLIPGQVGLEKSRMEYGMQGLGYQQTGLGQADEWYKKFKPVQEKYMREATGGINIGQRRTEAVAGVEHQFGQALPQYERNLSRRGLTMGSSDLRQMSISKAVAKSNASTMAKNTGEAEQFNRLGQASALQFKRPGLGA